jgi:hypothetical protein
MNYTLGRFFLAAALSAAPLLCQSPAPSNAAGTPEQPLLDYSLSFDTYSETKLGGDFTSANLLRNFDIASDRFELGAATLSVQLSKGQFGFHFDSGYGEIYKTMNAGDPWGGVNRYVGQAYVSVRPFKTSDFDLDFGKFYTSAGAEVPDAASNFQYSRSLLFTLGLPYYHFGLRASKSVTPSLVVGVQLINGWNDVVNNTGGPMLGLTSTYTKKRFNWSETYLAGPEPVLLSNVSLPYTIRPRKISQLIDSVLKLTPTTRLNAYVETLYGEEKNLAGRDHWYSVAGAVTIPVAARWSISPRWEYFNDATGATTGVAQQLQEVTATLQYQPRVPALTARAEFRCDFSDKPFFENNGTPSASRRQETALVALLYTWKGKQ